MRHFVGVFQLQNESRRKKKELIILLSRKKAAPPCPAGKELSAKNGGRAQDLGTGFKVSVWHTDVATPLAKAAGCHQGNIQVQTLQPTPWFCERELLRELP